MSFSKLVKIKNEIHQKHFLPNFLKIKSYNSKYLTWRADVNKSIQNFIFQPWFCQIRDFLYILLETGVYQISPIITDKIRTHFLVHNHYFRYDWVHSNLWFSAVCTKKFFPRHEDNLIFSIFLVCPRPPSEWLRCKNLGAFRFKTTNNRWASS